MEPGFQPTSVCFQNPDWFCNIRLPAEEETESWGGSSGELAQGRTLAPHTKKALGDIEGRQQKLQLLWTLYRTPPLPLALVTPLLPGNMALVLQAPGPPWGGVWLGSQGEGCPTYALEATCSLQGAGHRPSVTWPQCRGRLSCTSLFVNPLSLISALGIKEDFSATSVSNVTRVLLFCSTPDPLLGPGVLRGLDSGDCTSQDHLGVHPNSQQRGCGHPVVVGSLIPASWSLRKLSTPGSCLVAALHPGGAQTHLSASFGEGPPTPLRPS